MSYQPIEDYGVIGDLHTVALVGMDESIDFMCAPRFDSPSVFAAVLDDERGGRFRLAPLLEDARQKQLYLPDTCVLLTRFLSDDGVAEVSHFIPIEDGRQAHDVRSFSSLACSAGRPLIGPSASPASACRPPPRRAPSRLPSHAGTRSGMRSTRTSSPTSETRAGRHSWARGSAELDTSALLLPLLKFVAPADPRGVSTLRALERDLVSDSLVSRYRIGDHFSDGLVGDEGTFNMCSFWYVECLSRLGDLQQARFVFEKDARLREPPRALQRRVRPPGRAPRQLPAGVHSSAHQCCVRSRPPALGRWPLGLSRARAVFGRRYLDEFGVATTRPFGPSEEES